MSNNLPKWLQHANGDIPSPTPEEVEKDFQHERAAADRALAGKLTAQDWRDHEAIMAHYGAMTLDGKQPAHNGFSEMLARIDWQKVFIFTARAMAAASVAFLAYQYSKYFAAFGVGAMAFIGQFAIGIFFLVAILQSTNGLQIMTAALGLYLLVNSF